MKNQKCFETLENRTMLASFTPFPTEDGCTMDVRDLSGDGSVAVGEVSLFCRTLPSPAFRWEAHIGFEFFEAEASCRSTNVDASRLSANGERVIGSFPAPHVGRNRGCTVYDVTDWKQGERPTPIPDPPIDASAISGDGKMVIGHNGVGTLLRWHVDTNPPIVEALGANVGYRPVIFASHDGSVIAGNGRLPFRWTQSDGLTPLHGLEEVRGISADGRVIIGETSSESRFAWPAIWKNGEVEVFEAPPFTNGSFNAVSADGAILAGYFTGGATVWVNGKPETVSHLLTSQGVNVEGWRLTHVTDMSDDGTVLLGRGRSPEGDSQQWIAKLNLVAPAEPDLLGDVDGDGRLSAGDVDYLAAAWRESRYEQRLDFNRDNVIDAEDHRILIEELADTFYGDANFDGVFDTSDVVLVFQLAEYRDPLKANSTWTSGDWNGDGEFDSADFIMALQQGDFETGPRKT